ncbi:MAG TPA: TadE family protein [Acidimicrobiia bacterium]|nr:TadE family protein [Acidimicrobiia bacterium]
MGDEESCHRQALRRGRGEGAPLNRQSGQATVEFAVLMPLIVLAALIVLQVAFVVRDQVAVVHAAREAARAASVDPDSGRAVRAARRTLRAAEVDVGDRPAVGEPITVEVSYRSVTDLPLVGRLFPDPTLHSRVSMRVEK